MPPDLPLISAIVVSYNTREMTLECLRALSADMQGMMWDLWVVDNASTDGSADAIRGAFPEAHVITNERNLGFGAANNQAIKQAQGQFLLLLNSDAFVQPGAVQRLMDYMESHPEAAVAGPRLLNADGSLQISCYRFPSPGRAWLENLWISALFPPASFLGDYRRWPHTEQRAVDWVVGACMLVRSEAVESAGLFDESFFMYVEETDWQKRMRRRGWQIGFEPSAVVQHLGGGSGSGEVVNPYAFRSLDHYQLKHHGLPGLIIFRLAMIVGCSLRSVIWGFVCLLPSKRSDALLKVRRHLRLAWRQSSSWDGRARRAG